MLPTGSPEIGKSKNPSSHDKSLRQQLTMTTEKVELMQQMERAIRKLTLGSRAEASKILHNSTENRSKESAGTASKKASPFVTFFARKSKVQ
nr:hypothetical protein Iba_chr04dCG4480 [Ipomoea batatas]GMC88384.1 hypothetical protein Iba_chr04eCG9610 [Ipomoea batatas]GMC90057.1 hypothetical protein Iba_chr04fCG4500 [Ipomoea batatas]